ncbi:hypothetical protein [Streptomyces sp. NPDC091879]|uniref:hypothetical protein n=1 Tax=Streptomyces sp. NPDC091879 TaxID=3366006 RepID=UPI00381CB381
MGNLRMHLVTPLREFFGAAVPVPGVDAPSETSIPGIHMETPSITVPVAQE